MQNHGNMNTKTILAILLVLLCGCSRQDRNREEGKEYFTIEDEERVKTLLQENPYDFYLNRTLWSIYTEKGQWDALINATRPIFYREYDTYEEEKLHLYAGAFISQAYVFMEQFDSASFYLDRLNLSRDSEIWQHDPTLDALVSNTAAIINLKTELNYSAALEHYEKAYNAISTTGDTPNMTTLLCNIASIYYNMRDSSGYRYAHTAYRLAQEEGMRAYVKALSAILLAQMNYLKGDLDTATAIADRVSHTINLFPQFQSSLELLYADIYNERGDCSRADMYYQKALQHDKETDNGTNILIRLRYGTYLMKTNEPHKAKEILQEGLKISFEKKNMEFRNQLLYTLSEASLELGDEKGSLDYYKQYYASMDSISHIQKERAFQQYRLLQQEHEIQNKEIELLKSNRKIILIAAGTLLLAVIAVFLVVVNRRQNKSYKKLVEVHQQLLARMKSMREAEMQQNDNTGRNDQDSALWEKLETQMNSERIYRHHDISLDKIAAMLGTNRTYISRIINNFSGTTFSNYINSRRIEEASRILSDAGQDMPMKAIADTLGYNSISSFYRAFIKETGVPPSKYREEALKLKKQAS